MEIKGKKWISLFLDRATGFLSQELCEVKTCLN